MKAVNCHGDSTIKSWGLHFLISMQLAHDATSVYTPEFSGKGGINWIWKSLNWLLKCDDLDRESIRLSDEDKFSVLIDEAGIITVDL